MRSSLLSRYAYQTNSTYKLQPAEIINISKPRMPRNIVEKRVKKTPFIVKFIRFTVFALIGLFVIPFAFNKVTRNTVLNMPANNAIKTDYSQILNPTASYLNNNYFLGLTNLESVNKKSPLMQNLYETTEMFSLESKLKNLMLAYPQVDPSIFVWDIKTGNYVDIDANKVYPAASIIKLPVLIEMFRLIEQGKFSLYDRIPLTEYYRSEGSGDLQFAKHGNMYTVDELARVMIQNSDNTATNMIISQIGGMHSINSSLRQWGLNKTYVQTWLPDLRGTNTTTAREMATLLYNMNNNTFLSLKSREKIAFYMSNVKNNRLIKAGLPPEATFVHKTGDIGNMLGDAGIVYTPQGQRYIVVILAKRPFNASCGKDFIVNASKVIYDEFQNMSF